MVEPIETIVRDPVWNAERSFVPVFEAHPDRLGPDGAEFLNDAWAAEFDRRLAVWEAESPSVSPMLDAIVR